MNYTQDQWVDKYLSNDLTKEERKQFERMMKNNPNFQEDIRLKGLIKDAYMRDQLNIKVGQAFTEVHNDAHESITKKRKLILSLMALFVIFSILYYLLYLSILKSPSPPQNYLQLYAEYADWPDQLELLQLDNWRGSTIDSANANFKTDLDAINFHYAAQNYNIAQEMLQQQLENNGTEPLYFYLGIIQAKMASYDEAFDSFERASKFQDMAIWYMALIDLKLGHIDLAENKLKQISSIRHPRNTQATQLLTELTDIEKD